MLDCLIWLPLVSPSGCTGLRVGSRLEEKWSAIAMAVVYSASVIFVPCSFGMVTKRPAAQMYWDVDSEIACKEGRGVGVARGC